MTSPISFRLNILLFQEGNTWVAQCLERDVAGQGKTIDEATSAFERTFVGQIIIDVHNNEPPLGNIQRAPREYWEKFEKAKRLTDKIPFYLPDEIPPAFMIEAGAEELRISA